MKPGTCKIAPYSSSRSGAHPEPPTSGSRGRLPAGRCPLLPARRRTAPHSAERRVPHAPAAGRRSRHAAPQQPIGRFLLSAGGGRPARPCRRAANLTGAGCGLAVTSGPDVSPDHAPAGVRATPTSDNGESLFRCHRAMQGLGKPRRCRVTRSKIQH